MKKLFAFLYLWFQNEYCLKHLIRKEFDHDGWLSYYECEECWKEKKLKQSQIEIDKINSELNRVKWALKILKEK